MQTGIMGKAAALLSAAAAFFGFKSGANRAPEQRQGAGVLDGGTVARYQSRTCWRRRMSSGPLPGCPLRAEAFPPYPQRDLAGEINAQTSARWQACEKRKWRGAIRIENERRTAAGRGRMYAPAVAA